MEKEIVFVLLDDFADWEAAFLAPALRAGTMPGRPASYGVKYMTPDGRPVRSIGGVWGRLLYTSYPARREGWLEGSVGVTCEENKNTQTS